jgi:hypothetical protein
MLFGQLNTDYNTALLPPFQGIGASFKLQEISTSLGLV